MPFADVNGQRLYFTDSGGDLPVILFTHGFLMDHSMWEPQVEALAPTHRCVTWDARQWGQTTCDGRPFTYWDLAADGVALLDHLGVADAVWCGLSQGGFVSLRAALTDPDRVRALVLMDTSPHEESVDGRALYEAMWAQARADGIDATLTGAISGVLFGPSFDASVWEAKMIARPPDAFDQAMDCLVSRDDIADRLSAITCPALVIHGELDAAFPVDDAAGWSRDLPGLAEFVQVPGAGHTTNLEDPSTTNAVMERFLVSLAPQTLVR